MVYSYYSTFQAHYKGQGEFAFKRDDLTRSKTRSALQTVCSVISVEEKPLYEPFSDGEQCL